MADESKECQEGAAGVTTLPVQSNTPNIIFLFVLLAILPPKKGLHLGSLDESTIVETAINISDNAHS